MGKATRIKQQNAKEKIAAQRAAARRAEVRRRALWTGGAVVLVIVIVVAFVVIKLSSNNSPSTSSGGVTGTVLPASVQNDPAEEQRQAGDALHRRRVLPVLRRGALGHSGRAQPVRPLHHAVPWHPLIQHGHRPEHTDADLLPVQLHQPVPDVHPGRERER